MTGSKIKTETIPSQAKGWVAFVGSGPGDPDLLTVRAASLLREADVVITELPEHEQLVRVVLGLPEPRLVTDEDGNEALEEVGGPEFVDGGFGQDGQPLTHANRAKVVVKQARRGLRVVRLMNRSEEHTSELQSLMRISYAVFCL